MTAWYDIIGSIAISGAVILMIVTLNINMNSSGDEIFKSSYSQSAAISSAQVIESDIYKAGYKATGNKVLQSDSINFKFVSDINNDGSSDTVYYYRSTSSTPDKPVYRKVNSAAAIIVGSYSQFTFSYYDSLANILSYPTVSTQTGRNRIQSIELTSIIRWPSPNSDSVYQSASWRKLISPRNL